MTKGQLIHLNDLVQAHYNCMIRWAKTQDSEGRSSILNMWFSIEEDWSASYCPLCQRYDGVCFDCPIGQTDYCCDNLNSPWLMMSRRYVSTWSSWINAAYLMKTIVRGVLLKDLTLAKGVKS